MLHCNSVVIKNNLVVTSRPNAGFMQQLKLWGLMKHKLDNGHKAYRAYQLHHQARRMKGTQTTS